MEFQKFLERGQVEGSQLCRHSGIRLADPLVIAPEIFWPVVLREDFQRLGAKHIGIKQLPPVIIIGVGLDPTLEALQRFFQTAPSSGKTEVVDILGGGVHYESKKSIKDGCGYEHLRCDRAATSQNGFENFETGDC